VLQIGELAPAGAPPVSSPNAMQVPRGLTLDEVERMYIEATLRDLGGSVNAAAEQLGISRKVLWQRRKRHGIPDVAL
jgi:DNA-binding NtrC family response regulator